MELTTEAKLIEPSLMNIINDRASCKPKRINLRWFDWTKHWLIKFTSDNNVDTNWEIKFDSELIFKISACLKRECLMSKQIARADDCCRDNSIEFVAGRLCGGRHGHKRDKTKFKARHI